ncbi:penicillin-binding protein 2D [Sporosarcina sp. NCCP-2716]|uniref:transglycosylase domain-containing protein n=1 Tax=Sporosarcina sp. NCCP-2716 TaxID=2943679 RepID=UPI0020405A66|nr:PBP1A family penicillin-binding protein [Sporosarcina sp. NCCP-2716]GKV69108.1 penicillin-binding protein 2D [Sporosarcina sp. NCCP-2716]
MRRIDFVKKNRRRARFRFAGLLMITACTAVVTVLVCLRVYAQIAGPPSLSVPEASIFVDRNERQIGDRFSGERRYWVGLDDMSPFLVDAFVAVEDKNFYRHGGFDYKRIGGAVLKDVKARRKVEGASTITQQYARNLYLTNEKSWTRKANEALYAYRMEIFYDKERILEGYLNTVYFGHGMYGVEAASRYFFAKPAAKLTLEEAATIAAIPKGPSIYSPAANLEKSENRRKIVLRLMEEQGFISPEQQERAGTEAIALKTEEWADTKDIAPYFLNEAWQEAEKILISKGRYPAEGGWTIKTTLDLAHQKNAEEIIAAQMPENDLQIGFVSMKPETGEVTAMVGGRSYAESPFNRVTQAKRQPGSAMKPILYAAALEDGFNPLTFLSTEKTIFTYDDGRSSYEPSNVNGKFGDHPISLAQALAVSDNIYAVKTLEEIGYRKYNSMAEKLGIQVKFPESPAVALGTSAVTLFEMTGAYNRVASGGRKIDPVLILSIEDSRGKLVYEHPEQTKKRAMTEQNAFVLTHLMTGMFDPVFNDYLTSTGVSMRASQTRPYAAKSGTTLSDQYLIGYSPTLTAGIWTGYDVGRQIEDAQDKAASKRIWIDFMEAAHSGQRPEPFLPPRGVKGVTVDIETGGLAVDGCSKQRLVYVKERDVPKQLCTDKTLRESRLQGTKQEKGFELFPFSFFE